MGWTLDLQSRHQMDSISISSTYTLVAKWIRQRSSKALIVSSTLTEGAKYEFEISIKIQIWLRRRKA